MYDDNEDRPMPVEPDPRVVAMQRVVDLEQQHEWAAREANEREKKAAIIREELSTARAQLNDLLGLPSSNVKPMSGTEARQIGRNY